MYSLNLPSYDTKIRKKGSIVEIYDTLRHKYVTLTPEEWVRQHFVNWLVSDKKYPSTLMANETSIKLNSMSRRCDTVVYNQHLEPLMIIEYKESNIPVTQRVFDQAVSYNTVLKVKYIVVSNGISHYCCKMDYEKQTYDFLTDIPNYADL